MRGSIRQRSKGSWRIALEFGYQVDPKTGIKKRVQKFVTYRGAKRDAQEKLTELIGNAKRGEFVEPSRLTLATWLNEWLESSVKPRVRPSTYTLQRDHR
jgi:hypothetical protein